MREVARSEIRELPGNPRRIGDASRKRLHKGLDRWGLLAPVIVNRETMHLLGGHRRIEWADAKSGGKDYRIQVSIVDVPVDEEMTVAAFLNNEGAQGEWDADLLAQHLKSGMLDHEAAAFEQAQLETLVPWDEGISALFADAPPAVQMTADELAAMKDYRKKANKNVVGAGDTEHYLVVVFADRAEKDAFLKSRELPVDERYVSAEAAGLRASAAGAGPVRRGAASRARRAAVAPSEE